MASCSWTARRLSRGSRPGAHARRAQLQSCRAQQAFARPSYLSQESRTEQQTPQTLLSSWRHPLLLELPLRDREALRPTAQSPTQSVGCPRQTGSPLPSQSAERRHRQQP
eukprot:Amastigsp_a180480_322.p3 type:complete len:110 gc:universal Amastigsp_a180480_322:363-34(-)